MTPVKIEFLVTAEAEFEDAIEYYNQQSEVWVLNFAAEVEADFRTNSSIARGMDTPF